MRSALFGLCLLPVLAQAQVFKCVGNDGTTSYSAVPCPASEGQSTRIIEPAAPSGVAPPPVNLPQVDIQGSAEQPRPRNEERDEGSHSSGRGSRVTVIEDSASSSRDARVSEMRERAEREKRESYDRDYDRKRMQQMEQQIRQLQEQNKNNPR
ncbi:hypothetical protein PSm6_36400 [Pseudomonas solani]|uniref:DUF4124 domain-containing protein n=1 Tax=Pseudomonas solani TaxID=2731552 RepID=A0ABM7LCV9_9PSED|nr:DUF4124 domain-containing protein [Pseudomonas solani]EQM71826.1 hypothetical protein L682_29300 [Pseudomonas alcaligenes OT 69]MBB4821519.1 hypothetical protein [Pseudomonas alcaligenes]MDN4149305.1 DUF4124 domain-containing protein [Pseudomonas tohonis]BCD87233.1 hypothetical protein PSm6_36400 [Pseudomonas solani]